MMPLPPAYAHLEQINAPTLGLVNECDTKIAAKSPIYGHHRIVGGQQPVSHSVGYMSNLKATDRYYNLERKTSCNTIYRSM